MSVVEGKKGIENVTRPLTSLELLQVEKINELEAGVAQWKQAAKEAISISREVLNSRKGELYKRNQALESKLADAAEFIQHALAMGNFTPGGSTEGWANRILGAIREGKA